MEKFSLDPETPGKVASEDIQEQIDHSLDVEMLDLAGQRFTIATPHPDRANLVRQLSPQEQIPTNEGVDLVWGAFMRGFFGEDLLQAAKLSRMREPTETDMQYNSRLDQLAKLVEQRGEKI